MRTAILESEVTFHPQQLVKPLILSSGAIERITEARVNVRVSIDGRESIGRGSIYLSDLWAWPDPEYSHEQRESILKDLCQTVSAQLVSLVGTEREHPLELGLRLHDAVADLDDKRFTAVPPLARSMCLSPFDAAVHDGVGIALGRSAFAFFDDAFPIPSADSLFARGGACAAIKRTMRPTLRRELPAWMIVGKNDDFDRDVKPWVVERGYRCFKLKLMGGHDCAADVARTIDVFSVLQHWGVSNPSLSVDTNEANPDEQSVFEYLSRLKATDTAAFQSLKYLEQPTGRDILKHRFDWRRVTSFKPVLLDEGLTDLELLPTAREQGWSGLALKTCKGHSFALIAAAWAQEQGMLLSLQDLTNPGYSLIHAALLAAHLPTINGVELNSPQFTPAANATWLPRLSSLFEPRDGSHRLPVIVPAGLGSSL